MKNTTSITIVFLFLSIQTFGQNSINQFVKKYKGQENITHVSLPGWVLRLSASVVSKKEMEGVDLKAIAKKIAHLSILTFDNTTPNSEDVTQLIKGLKAENYEDLIMIRHGKEKINIMIKESKDIVRQLVILVNGNKKDDFVLLSISGKFTMDDINKVVAAAQSDSGHKKNSAGK
jgi:hypothetical protein